jgi:ribose 5-phosphate isomerase A
MDLRQLAAQRAVDFVESGMALGLGTGVTTRYFIDLLGEKLAAGELHDLCGVPTSQGSAAQAQRWGIPIVTLEDYPELDLAVDGADEVDPNLNLIKGLGRALLREKVVEIHARRLIIVVDESKLVTRLGTRGPLPVEILPFEAPAHIRWLNNLGCRAELWLEDDGLPARTDNGNYLARLWFPKGIRHPKALARKLAGRPGVLEHGLFLNMAETVIVAAESGVQILERSK